MSNEDNPGEAAGFGAGPIPTPATDPNNGLVSKEKEDATYATEPIGGMSVLMHRALAVWFCLLGVASIWCLIDVWPSKGEDTTLVRASSSPQTPTAPTKRSGEPALAGVRTPSQSTTVTPEAVPLLTTSVAPTPTPCPSRSVMERLLTSPGEACSDPTTYFLIAFLTGVLGGTTHGLASLADFRGNRRLFRSWSLWYFVQPLLGGMVAVILYVVLRGGLLNNLNPTLEEKVLNPYGFAALGALTGMFTDRASDRLRDAFDAFFNAKHERDGKLKES